MNTKTENRICQNCKKGFTIEPEDFNFYEKIKVPPPTFCPECRMIRRMLWRNIRSLYKRKCDSCGKSLISMYSDKDNAPVYCTECWNGDKRDQYINAKDYDFTKPFFEQLKELFKINPRFYSYKFKRLVNSEFTNYALDVKNTYLSYSAIDCEDVLYSETISRSKNSVDCFSVNKVDGCYFNIECDSNYNTHFSVSSNNCIDSHFLFDCVNCQSCCMSSNLRNQKYVFKNKKLSKEDYEKSVKELRLETHTGFKSAMNYLKDVVIKNAIHRHAFIHSSQNAIGDYIYNSRNVKDSFIVGNSENIAFGMRVLDGVKDSYDLLGIGFECEMIYDSMAATSNTYKDYFCYITIEGCRECEYSLILKNCSNCFGCVGLNNAKYCILNKQYEKEEYFEMIKKIKDHMNNMPYVDQKGRIFKYGEFFPYDMSPFGYNETTCNYFFPVIKEIALEKGYTWEEQKERKHKATINSNNLPDDIKDVSDKILNEIISCPNNGDLLFQCTAAFKITQEELRFYKQKNLPLPRFCPNCRHYQRLSFLNPPVLYHRQCMCNKENHFHGTGNCKAKFETSYAPDRPEIVYCERCYQQEIY